MNYPYKIQALKNYPNGGDVKKGEIGLLVRSSIYDFPSQRGYYIPKEHVYISSKYKILQQEKEIIYEIY